MLWEMAAPSFTGCLLMCLFNTSTSTGRWTEARIRERAPTNQGSYVISISNKSLSRGEGVEINDPDEVWGLLVDINYP